LWPALANSSTWGFIRLRYGTAAENRSSSALTGKVIIGLLFFIFGLSPGMNATIDPYLELA
jgi:hypothetical protein